MAKIKPAVAPDMEGSDLDVGILLVLTPTESMALEGVLSAAMVHIDHMLGKTVQQSKSKCEAIHYLLMTAEIVEQCANIVNRLPESNATALYDQAEVRVLEKIAKLLEANRHTHADGTVH